MCEEERWWRDGGGRGCRKWTRPLLGSLKTWKTSSYGTAEDINVNSCGVPARRESAQLTFFVTVMAHSSIPHPCTVLQPAPPILDILNSHCSYNHIYCNRFSTQGHMQYGLE